MATLAESIQMQITAIDTQMTSVSPTSVSADGTSVTNPEWTSLIDKRLVLQGYLDRLNGTAPMIVRGRIRGF